MPTAREDCPLPFQRGDHRTGHQSRRGGRRGDANRWDRQSGWAQDLYYLRKRYEGRAAVVRLLKNSSFPPSAVLWARGFTARDWTGWGGCAGYEFKLADGWLGDFTREFGLSKETLCDMPVDGTMTNWWNVAAGRMPQNVELYAAVGMKLWVFPDSHECFLYWSGSP